MSGDELALVKGWSRIDFNLYQDKWGNLLEWVVGFGFVEV
jgi:hypothetical protein